jgi:hypothetical protein
MTFRGKHSGIRKHRLRESQKEKILENSSTHESKLNVVIYATDEYYERLVENANYKGLSSSTGYSFSHIGLTNLDKLLDYLEPKNNKVVVIQKDPAIEPEPYTWQTVEELVDEHKQTQFYVLMHSVKDASWPKPSSNIVVGGLNNISLLMDYLKNSLNGKQEYKL